MDDIRRAGLDPHTVSDSTAYRLWLADQIIKLNTMHHKCQGEMIKSIEIIDGRVGSLEAWRKDIDKLLKKGLAVGLVLIASGAAGVKLGEKALMNILKFFS